MSVSWHFGVVGNESHMCVCEGNMGLLFIEAETVNVLYNEVCLRCSSVETKVHSYCQVATSTDN